jgi:phage N-6-adenine-methyltransferase
VSVLRYRASNHPQQTAVRGSDDEVDDRGTDPQFVGDLAARLGGPFTLDVAAAAHNAKCARWYGRADNGLEQPWPGRIWANPPFSHPNLSLWLRKAWAEWNSGRPELVVMLLPANRTEQGWWQQLVEPYRDRPGSPLRIEFLPGRMRFVQPGRTAIGPNERPPFGCCLAIWERVGPAALVPAQASLTFDIEEVPPA